MFNNWNVSLLDKEMKSLWTIKCDEQHVSHISYRYDGICIHSSQTGRRRGGILIWIQWAVKLTSFCWNKRSHEPIVQCNQTQPDSVNILIHPLMSEQKLLSRKSLWFGSFLRSLMNHSPLSDWPHVSSNLSFPSRPSCSFTMLPWCTFLSPAGLPSTCEQKSQIRCHHSIIAPKQRQHRFIRSLWLVELNNDYWHSHFKYNTII